MARHVLKHKDYPSPIVHTRSEEGPAKFGTETPHYYFITESKELADELADRDDVVRSTLKEMDGEGDET